MSGMFRYGEVPHSILYRSTAHYSGGQRAQPLPPSTIDVAKPRPPELHVSCRLYSSLHHPSAYSSDPPGVSLKSKKSKQAVTPDLQLQHEHARFHRRRRRRPLGLTLTDTRDTRSTHVYVRRGIGERSKRGLSRGGALYFLALRGTTCPREWRCSPSICGTWVTQRDTCRGAKSMWDSHLHPLCTSSDARHTTRCLTPRKDLRGKEPTLPERRPRS